MKKTTVFSTFFILLIYQSLLSGQQNQKPAADFFKDVRNASLDVLPDSFKAGLSGQAIDKKISSIPRDSYLDKSKNASVEIIYSKIKGITITVLNVDDLYRDMYKDLPRQFFAFDILLSERSTESFLNKYEMSYYSSGFDPIILRLRIKGAENTVLLYIDRANYRLHRIDYLLGGSLISTTEVFYNDYEKEGKTYTVPYRFVTKSGNGSNSARYDILEMVNISLNGQ